MARDLGIPFNATPTQTSKPKQGMEGLQVSTGLLARSQGARNQLLTRQAEEATQAAVEANKPSTIAKETGKGVVGQLLTGPVRALRSGVDFIGEKLTGTKPAGEFTGFMGEPVQTYQGELASGKSPLAVGGEVALDVASILPVGKGVQATKALAPKATSALGKVAAPVLGPIKNFLAQRAEKKATQTAVDALIPKGKDLTPTEYEELLNKGRLQPKTTTSPAKIIANENDKRLATTYKSLLAEKDPVKNVNSVLNAIAEKDKEVGDYLRSQNKFQTAYNTGELKNYLMENIKGIRDIYVPDESRVTALKEDVVNSLINGLSKNDLENLWQSRKSFDRVIDSKINAFGGSPTLKKEIAVGIRNAAQQFIKDKSGDSFYGDKMKEMTDLFEIRDLLDTKAVKEKGKSAILTWMRDNPGKTKALEWALGGSAILGIGKAATGD